MLGASVFITAFLWYKLGTSAEYRSHGSTIDLHAIEEHEDEENSKSNKVTEMQTPLAEIHEVDQNRRS